MNFIIVHNVFSLLVIIVIKAIQPDCYKIKGSSVLLLETPLTRSKYISPYTHAQHLTRTSRIFYTFAVTKPLKIPLQICSFTSSLLSVCHDRKTRPLSLKAHCRMKYRLLFRTYHMTWKIDQYLVHFQLIFVLAFAVWSFTFSILKFCFLILTYLL